MIYFGKLVLPYLRVDTSSEGYGIVFLRYEGENENCKTHLLNFSCYSYAGADYWL